MDRLMSQAQTQCVRTYGKRPRRVRDNNNEDGNPTKSLSTQTVVSHVPAARRAPDIAYTIKTRLVLAEKTINVAPKSRNSEHVKPAWLDKTSQISPLETSTGDQENTQWVQRSSKKHNENTAAESGSKDSSHCGSRPPIGSSASTTHLAHHHREGFAKNAVLPRLLAEPASRPATIQVVIPRSRRPDSQKPEHAAHDVSNSDAAFSADLPPSDDISMCCTARSLVETSSYPTRKRDRHVVPLFCDMDEEDLLFC